VASASLIPVSVTMADAVTTPQTRWTPYSTQSPLSFLRTHTPTSRGLRIDAQPEAVQRSLRRHWPAMHVRPEAHSVIDAPPHGAPLVAPGER